jgi:hypothetical protein
MRDEGVGFLSLAVKFSIDYAQIIYQLSKNVHFGVVRALLVQYVSDAETCL